MLRSIGGIRHDPLAFLVRMRAEHGDILQFPIPAPATYLVSDPDAVRRVLVTNARAYGKRTPQYSSLSLVTGEGLLTADTAAWRPQRTLVQPAFHRSSLELVATHVADAVERLLATWRYLDGHVVDVDAAMMHLALEVVGESLFGSDLSGEADQLARATLDALDVVVKKARSPLQVPLSVPTPTNVVLRRAVARLDATVEAMLAERARRPLPDGAPARDMLDLLLASHADDGSQLSRAQVRDQVVTFIVAGHETVASALTWAWCLLAQDGAALARVRDEVEAVTGGTTPRSEHLPRLPFTSAVLDEVLRLYPPAWLVTRRSLEPDVLADVEVPADALVIISPWIVHRDERVWPDPERFDPTRVLDAAGERRRELVASPAYVPFGAGPRLCIGRDMALLEGVLVLASLASRVDLELVGTPPRAVPLVTVRPAHGLPMRLRVR
ncbi:MAG TPA: cytochrome P450 [Candidatus Nanopelagicales bacterium]|nr:cytochrome P450 [Candidatus Nanopelagicales bacterium]